MNSKEVNQKGRVIQLRKKLTILAAAGLMLASLFPLFAQGKNREPVRPATVLPYGNVVAGKTNDHAALLGSNIDTGFDRVVTLETKQMNEGFEYGVVVVEAPDRNRWITGGLNQAGLASVWAPIFTGQPENVVDEVLSKAANVKEAIVLLQSYEMKERATGSFLLADQKGRLAWLESDGTEWDLRSFIDETKVGQAVTVNALTSPLFTQGNEAGIGGVNDKSSNQWWRHQRLQELIGGVNTSQPGTLAEVLADEKFTDINPSWNLVLPGWGFAISNPVKDGETVKWGTKASYILDPKQGAIWFLTVGSAHEKAEYVPFLLTDLRNGEKVSGAGKESDKLPRIPWQPKQMSFSSGQGLINKQPMNHTTSQAETGANQGEPKELTKRLNQGTSNQSISIPGTQNPSTQNPSTQNPSTQNPGASSGDEKSSLNKNPEDLIPPSKDLGEGLVKPVVEVVMKSLNSLLNLERR